MKTNTELADQLAQVRAQSQNASQYTDMTAELQMLRQKNQDQAKVINALVQNVGPVPETNEHLQQTISEQKQRIQTLEAQVADARVQSDAQLAGMQEQVRNLT